MAALQWTCEDCEEQGMKASGKVLAFHSAICCNAVLSTRHRPVSGSPGHLLKDQHQFQTLCIHRGSKEGNLREKQKPS